MYTAYSLNSDHNTALTNNTGGSRSTRRAYTFKWSDSIGASSPEQTHSFLKQTFIHIYNNRKNINKIHPHFKQLGKKHQ